MLIHYTSATTQDITARMRVADVAPTTMPEGGREAPVQQTEGIYAAGYRSIAMQAIKQD